jgi:(p)ppGpp synthase/HD superfamily hydrolase
MTKRIEKAIEFVKQKHEGQYRRGGLPYSTHPIAVAEMLAKDGYGEEFVLTGLFHDLLEDTSATEAEILELGGEEVLRAVKLLTKQKGYTMSAYMQGILENPIAKAVKIADRTHNVLSLKEADEAFRERYLKETEEWYIGLSEKIANAVAVIKEE